MTTAPPPQAQSIRQRIADELGVRPNQVAAAVTLLDDGATVPFIARYRKEATGTLDDAQLRTLEERLGYLRELEDRRAAVLEEIRKQGKLDPALEERIRAAESKARLEDIYLPYKPKRRTKAQVARENGLEPLADTLLGDPTLDPQETAAAYVNEQVPDAAAALEGARAVLVERFAEDADLIGGLRERMWTRGRLVTKVREGKETDGAKYADYFDYSEPFTKLPSHRILAVFRGEKEEVLDVALEPDSEVDTAAPGAVTDWERLIAAAAGVRAEGRAADRWLADCVRFAWRTRILMHLSVDIRVRLRAAAEEGAISVFANNLRDLLLAAPAGSRATMGLDPGLRMARTPRPRWCTGCSTRCWSRPPPAAPAWTGRPASRSSAPPAASAPRATSSRTTAPTTRRPSPPPSSSPAPSTARVPGRTKKAAEQEAAEAAWRALSDAVPRAEPMPELPEVEVVRRGLEQWVAGRTVADRRGAPPARRPPAPRGRRPLRRRPDRPHVHRRPPARQVPVAAAWPRPTAHPSGRALVAPPRA